LPADSDSGAVFKNDYSKVMGFATPGRPAGYYRNA
jgi:hypothetical protein